MRRLHPIVMARPVGLMALLLGLLFVPQSALAEFTLKVVDEQGEAVPKFEVMVHVPNRGRISWNSGAQGKISLEESLLHSAAVANVVARADGYAPSLTRFVGDDLQKLLSGEQSVTVRRGSEVKLKFALPGGTELPKDFQPEVYFDECALNVRFMRSQANRRQYDRLGHPEALDVNMFNARPNDSGEFTFRIAADSPPFVVGVHVPGFLQSFDAGPFVADDVKGGLLEVALPKPATLEVQFDLGSADPAALPFRAANVHLLARIGGKNTTIVTHEPDLLTSKSLKQADLPPGDYSIMLSTIPQTEAGPGSPEEADPGRFRDILGVNLNAGQTETVTFRYEPLDLDAFRGNRTAVLRIERADGQPAAGREVTVGYVLQKYGTLTVFSGTVPESGEITLSDLSDAQPANEPDRYIVRSKDARLGSFKFKTSEPSERFVFRCPPEIGDIAPDIELADVTTGKTIKLSDLRGQLVVLDFWATWCGPCQPALEKLDKLAMDRGDEWKDRVALVPISIDENAEMAQRHLVDRGWTRLIPYWTGAEGKIGWEAPALRAFVVNSVPTSLLIDRDGRILWRGHPMSTEGGQNLEARIEAALK